MTRTGTRSSGRGEGRRSRCDIVGEERFFFVKGTNETGREDGMSRGPVILALEKMGKMDISDFDPQKSFYFDSMCDD